MNVSNCSAYELIEESKILDLNSTGYLLRHKKSGARVAVLENDDEKPEKKSFFGKKDKELDDDYGYDEPDEPVSKPRFLGRSSNKVVPMKRGGMEVTMVKPTSMNDSQEICQYLLAGKAVVLNMEGLNMEVAQRIIDFASGATYSMNGNLQKISNSIFIATPESVELSGDFQELISGGAASFSGMGMRI